MYVAAERRSKVPPCPERNPQSAPHLRSTAKGPATTSQSWTVFPGGAGSFMFKLVVNPLPPWHGTERRMSALPLWTVAIARRAQWSVAGPFEMVSIRPLRHAQERRQCSDHCCCILRERAEAKQNEPRHTNLIGPHASLQRSVNKESRPQWSGEDWRKTYVGYTALQERARSGVGSQRSPLLMMRAAGATTSRIGKPA